MFDYSKMIERALEYFPLWTDIRKRKTKSIGGQLIDSSLKETLELESAINDYKKSYFLNTYDSKEEDVIDFVYSVNIGIIEDFAGFNVIYNNKYYPLTLNIKEFYSNDKLSLPVVTSFPSESL